MFEVAHNWIETRLNALRLETGQTMAEYGVVLSVIALTVIVAFTALSGGIQGAINNVTNVLTAA